MPFCLFITFWQKNHPYWANRQIHGGSLNFESRGIKKIFENERNFHIWNNLRWQDLLCDQSVNIEEDENCCISREEFNRFLGFKVEDSQKVNKQVEYFDGPVENLNLESSAVTITSDHLPIKKEAKTGKMVSQSQRHSGSTQNLASKNASSSQNQPQPKPPSKSPSPTQTNLKSSSFSDDSIEEYQIYQNKKLTNFDKKFNKAVEYVKGDNFEDLYENGLSEKLNNYSKIRSYWVGWVSIYRKVRNHENQDQYPTCFRYSQDKTHNQMSALLLFIF